MKLKIKELRKKNNLSQQELADKIEVSVRMFSEYEKETSDIPFKKLQKIAEVLNIKIIELLNDFDYKKDIIQLNEPEAVYENSYKNDLIEVLKGVNNDLKNDKLEMQKDKELLKEIIQFNLGKANAS